MFLFILKNSFIFVVFVTSLFGYGNAITNKFTEKDQFNSASLDITIGLSILILYTQIALILGFFNKFYILIFFIFGLFLTKNWVMEVIEDFKNYKLIPSLSESYEKLIISFLFILFFIIPLFFKMLSTPLAWDELMYHLPHAKLWAENGFLSVNDNFRYPWFPFNFDILYSIPLLFGNSVFPKFIHGLAGFLIAFLFSVYFKKDKLTVIIFCCIWFYITRSMYEKAYVDMALALFVSSSLLVFNIWANNKNKFYLFISVFFMGIAIGIKYQALLFLPMYALLFFSYYKNFSFKILVLLFFIFIIPCIYWYARNYFLTGNPINPILGNFFGFYDWSKDDVLHQFNALSNRKHFIAPVTLFFPILLFINYKFNDKNLLRVFYCVTGSTVIWFFVSGYGRYLYGILPWIFYFASTLYVYIYQNSLKILFSRLYLKLNVYIQNIFKIVLIIVVLVASIDPIKRINRSLQKISFDEVSKNEILVNQVTAFKGIKYINSDFNLSRTYQYGAEDSIFYFDKYVLGDVFGFGRYKDFVFLESKDLYDKLNFHKIDSVLITNNNRNTMIVESLFNRLNSDKKRFKLIYSDESTNIFRLNND